MKENKVSWWKQAVIYQIYPRSFQDSNGDGIGDLPGIIARIPYLKHLGVDGLWICPVYESPNDDNGYDISDYMNIDPQFGTMEDMKALIKTARHHGIQVLIDLVVNHTSDEHPWFIESRSSKDSQKRDWYIWKEGVDGNPPTDWPSMFGGGVWEYDQITNEYYFHTFSRKQPDLNWENPQVRLAVYEMMNWWIDQGVSGFRVDAITFIKKNQSWPQKLKLDDLNFSILDGGCCNQPGIMRFLREMRDQVLIPRGVVTVAEAPGVTLNEMSEYIGEGVGVFSMIFTFDHVDLDIRFDSPGKLFSWTLSEWKSKMTGWQRAIGNSGWLGLFLENHDHPRSVSRFGNTGKYAEDSAKTLATWYFLMRGTPFIYQGQELGMSNCSFTTIDDYRDIASINAYREGIAAGFSPDEMIQYLSKRSRDHARTPMPWNSKPHAGFTSGKSWIDINPDNIKVNVDSQLEEKNSVLEYYRKLISLRKSYAVFTHGDFEELEPISNLIGGYCRHFDGEVATIWCNFSEETVVLQEPIHGKVILNTGVFFDGRTLAPWQSFVAVGSE